MLGCYRKGDCADPEVYTRAIIAVFSRYPADVVRSVTDPAVGLPSKYDWPPSVKQVVDACGELFDRVKKRIEREGDIRKQLSERDQREEELTAPRVDLKAKYGETYGLPPVKHLKTDYAAALARTAHLTDQAIEREYTERGEEPKMCGSLVISRSLAENIAAGTKSRVQLGPTETEST